MHNVINIISGVSIFGIMISTAALVIVLSSFSGMANLVTSFYTDFYQDIQIVSKNTKTFNRNFIPQEAFQVDGLVASSEVIEEIVMVEYDQQIIQTYIKGVEPTFIEMAKVEENLNDGKPILSDEYGPLAVIGFQALSNLNAYIYTVDGSYESLSIYAPNRDQKIKTTGMNIMDGLNRSQIDMVAVFSYGTDASDNYILVPINYAADLLNYKNDITSIEMDFEDDVDLENKKREIQNIIGPSFKVETRYEQNEIIYKTNKSEKWMTSFLLAFIFFLATFNMVATITMIVIEKRTNLKTLYALGAKKSQLEKIFFYEGLLINGVGMVLGLLIGYGICILQQEFGLIRMGGAVEYFPILFKLEDFITILTITTFFGILAAYLPSKILIKRILN